jgi:diaminopimelate decarboxylase
MTGFAYRNGVLHAEEVDLARLAESVGTPFYCYSSGVLARRYRAFASVLPKDALIAFSVKANGNVGVLKTLAKLGAGADIVSGGELKRAVAAGIAPARIVFSGIGKTAAEMRLALLAGIHQFNVESEPELEALNAVALSMNLRAPVALRVNPDVDARTHAKITTGTAETKFGIPWSRAREAYALAARLGGIEIVGVDVHIGSQVTALEPFVAAFARLAELVGKLRGDGHAIARVDLGGGLGVSYGEGRGADLDAYGAMVSRYTFELGAQLVVEPGRWIAAEAGVLVAGVLYVKRGERKEFAILDAGMNDLIRPALYDAHHEIVCVRESGPAERRYDVVGPVCETSDVFARDRMLPRLKSGDLVAFLAAGAYGAVMASAYNARPPAPEVLVKGGMWSLVRPRPTDDALIAADRVPPWLEDQAH